MTSLWTVVTACCIIWVLALWYRSERKNAALILENNKISYSKRSAEVRLGKTIEHVAPFFNQWPYDPSNFRFLGGPIDGISFNEDGIVFMEIKTGGSKLSKNQNKIKSLVKDGKVKFLTFRVNEDGVSVKE